MHSKGNLKQNEKATHRMGEDICKRSNRQGINLQNILQTAHAAQYQKNKQPNKKRVKDLNIYFSKEDIQMAKSTQKDAQHH